MSGQAAIVEFLSDPAAYPEAPRNVERIETHISWVFLTDSGAYKLKKAVMFDFLDFSTLELRRAACDDEVRLNRRLAKSVYQGVLPITVDSESRLALHGSGGIVDFVVHMRRLPAERSLDRLVASRDVSPEQLDQVATRLAEFYRSLPPLPINAREYRQRIEAHVRANRRDLLRTAAELPELLIRRLHGNQLRFLALRGDLFDGRLQSGKVVEGHGDLRPEHVYLLPEPVVLDCIEFNVEYRQIDVLDELGFLAMEFDRLGAAESGALVLSKVLHELNDVYPPALLAFYKTYRACVRAKVAALRAVQHTGSDRDAALAEAGRYLDLARRESTPLPGPLVVLVRGLSGSGKSTVAEALAERLGAEWLSTDVIRKEVLAEAGKAADDADRYQPEQRAAVYDRLLARGQSLLGSDLAVVLDGTFLTADLCHRAETLAREFDAPFLAVECRCPMDVARQRIAQRLAHGNSASEAFPEILASQQREQEPLPGEMPSCVLDTTTTTDESVTEILKRLSS